MTYEAAADRYDSMEYRFTGASGLLSVVLKPQSDQALSAMFNGFSLFGMGYSWGGFESLAVPFKPGRTAVPWTREGSCMRLHIGLEDPEDLIADLERGFAALR